MSPLILLPFHQDERLSDRSIVLPGAMRSTVVEPDLPPGNQWSRLVALYDAHADEVARVAADGPVRVVTGDCLATVGTLAGLQRAGLDPSIVWFDAHGDVHTLASSESGYLGGFSLRMVLGGDPGKLGEPLGLRPLPEDRAVLVDARDLDPAEAEYLASAGLTHTTVREVSVDDLPDGPVLLHVDLDVIDADEIPGLRFPAADGPSRTEVRDALQGLIDSGRVVTLDVACPWEEPRNEDEVARRAGVLAALLALDLA